MLPTLFFRFSAIPVFDIYYVVDPFIYYAQSDQHEQQSDIKDAIHDIHGSVFFILSGNFLSGK